MNVIVCRHFNVPCTKVKISHHFKYISPQHRAKVWIELPIIHAASPPFWVWNCKPPPLTFNKYCRRAGPPGFTPERDVRIGTPTLYSTIVTSTVREIDRPEAQPTYDLAISRTNLKRAFSSSFLGILHQEGRPTPTMLVNRLIQNSTIGPELRPNATVSGCPRLS